MRLPNPFKSGPLLVQRKERKTARLDNLALIFLTTTDFAGKGKLKKQNLSVLKIVA